MFYTKPNIRTLWLNFTIFWLVFGGAFAYAIVPLFAQEQRMTLLLDAEIDDYINTLAKPVFKAAGLSPENVHVLILNSPQINAFVNSQHALFMMSGLILEAKNSNEVLGVIAHEIGHLKGHHILRLNENQAGLNLSTLIGGILGLGAIAAGSPQAGSAILVGSQAAGISSFLRFSRSQEQQADQIAVNLLNELDYSTEGLQQFFSRLSVQNQMFHQSPPEYLLTHPKPSGRENFLEKNVTKPFTPSPRDQQKFKRVQAKIMALTHSPAQTRRKLFNEEDGFADYARAIAFYRSGLFKEAKMSLKLTRDKLNLEDDPYIDELNGHIALDQGETKKAEAFFAKAIDASPKSTLIRYHYGRTLRINQDYHKAIAQLGRVIQRHNTWWMPHEQIGLAYGKLGGVVQSRIHLAQAALYQGNYQDAKFHLDFAQKELAKNAADEQNQYIQTINLLKLELEKLQN